MITIGTFTFGLTFGSVARTFGDTSGTFGDTGRVFGDTGGVFGDTGGTLGDTGGTLGDTGGTFGLIRFSGCTSGCTFAAAFCCNRSEMDMLCDIDADKSALVCSCVLVSGGMLRFIFSCAINASNCWLSLIEIELLVATDKS